MSNSKKSVKNPSRRKFVKTAAYVAPAILTLKAASSFAAVGSVSQGPDFHLGQGGRERGGFIRR